MDPVTVRCDGCHEWVDTTGALREVASWLILDCPRCRRQSDVTFRLDAQVLFHAPLETSRR